MTGISSLGLTALGLGLGLFVFTPSTLAYFEQTQSQRLEQSMTAEVNGSGAAKVEVSQRAGQTQSQVMSGGVGYARVNHGRVSHYQYSPVRTDGQVYLNWWQRGGTCHVRYTESRNRSYKYTTAAACDDGGITIGGLRPGWSYRFQVKKDDGVWSNPVRIVAG